MELATKEVEPCALPDGWRRVSLTSLLERGERVTYGVVQPGRNDPDGVLFIRGGDISGGRILEDQLRRIPKAVSRQYARTLLRGGEIVICLVGYPGETAIVPPSLVGANIARQVALVRLAANQDVASAFVCRFLQSDVGQRLLLGEAIGSAQKVINLRDINRLVLTLPTFPEQEAIAAALADADAWIESLEKVIAKKGQIKNGVMQQLLTGKSRLPGFNAPWSRRRLGDVSTIKARIGWQGLTTAEYRESGDFALVTGTEFSEGGIVWERCFFVDRTRYMQDRNIQLARGDVLVTKDGTIGKVAFVDDLPIAATLNSGVFVLRPLNQQFDPRFFAYLLQSSQFGEFLARLSAGSTINHLYQKDIVHFLPTIPTDIEEQRSIAWMIAALDSDLKLSVEKLEKARLLKQGMMQTLLKGKVRLA